MSRTVVFKDLIGILLIMVLARSTAHGAVPGVTPGELTVSPAGSAQYDVPIVVPPGTAGMEPTLSLNYDSDSGNGLVGVGWGVGGLSDITRCPQTHQQDGVDGNVNFDSNDRFCLDGKRLMAISGVYGANGTEYRTELDSYTKVVSYTDGAATNGPAWFRVWTKTGQILDYGNTADSRIEVVGTNTVRVWAVNKISDPSGNYQTYRYIEDQIEGSYWPDRIDYTGNAAAGVAPYNSVRFTYSGPRTDTMPLYQAGYPVHVTELLTDIKTYAGGSLVKSYQLNYEISMTTGRNRLVSITECGSSTGTAADTCLNPTTFGFEDTDGMFGTMAEWDNTATAYSSQWQQAFIDMNNDGFTDYVRYYMPAAGVSDGTRVRVNLHNGNSSSTTSALGSAVAWDSSAHTQGCSMLNALVVQDLVQFDGVVVESGTDIGLAVVA